MTTLSPDVALEPGAYEPPAPPAAGNVLVEMVLAEYTLMLWDTWAAAAYVLLPGSLKSTTHSPAPVNVTLPPLREHLDELLSMEMATLSPDVAVALAEYVPRTLPALGGALALMALAIVPAANAGVADSPNMPAMSAKLRPTTDHRPLLMRPLRRWFEICKFLIRTALPRMKQVAGQRTTSQTSHN
jgi:hypothetical protein